MGSEILLVSKDLIFETKIVGTAQAVGRSAAAVSNLAAAPPHISPATRLVLIDLADPAITTEEIRAFRISLPPNAVLLAFGSHVDVDRLRAAREAGCHPVLPRSALVERLPQLLQHPESLTGSVNPKA